MHSHLFDAANLEAGPGERFTLQNPQLVRITLGDDVVAVKGAMVAYQGGVTFHHQGAGGVGKFLKKLVTTEDVPLMRVSGPGQVFFAHEAGYVHLLELTGDGLSVNGNNLLAFDATLEWDIRRTAGVGVMSTGLFTTVISGTGTVALCSVGHPMVLDCSAEPTYVDVNSAVGWSSNLVPKVVSSVNMRSVLRGGSGEAFQYAFHGQGFVVVQPSEWDRQSPGGGGGGVGGFLG
jgi:uncharacterized protein (AIM24 family)